jgi:hypothetical protein
MSVEERISRLEERVAKLEQAAHVSGDTSYKCVSFNCRTCTGVFLWRLQSCTGWSYEGQVSIREG